MKINIKKFAKSEFDDYTNIDGEEKEKFISEKIFRNKSFQEITTGEKFSIYYFPLIRILCFFQQCHLQIY